MTGGSGIRRLWSFDYDGTLSPIVPVRAAAGLHPACRSLLADLVRSRRSLVAILSSRSLGDLASRVPVRGVFLGGGSGLEWRLPRGGRIVPDRESEARAERARTRIMPVLQEIASVPGADVEDKVWSIAVHSRRVLPEGRAILGPLLDTVRREDQVRVFDGPAVAEILLQPDWDKSRGLETLCRFLRFDPSGGGVVYAGDDENDGTAMRWTISRRGIAISVGNRPRVSGARIVSGPAALARAVRRLASLSGGEAGRGGRNGNG